MADSKSTHEISYTLKIKNQITKKLQQVEKALKKNKDAIVKASEASEKASSKAQNAIIRGWNKVASKVRGAGAKLSASVQSFTGKFKEAGREAGIFSGRLGSMLTKFGGAAIIIASVAIAVAGVGLAYKEAFKSGTEYEASMSKLGAISQATTQDMEKLEQQSMYLGETTVFSAKQVADAFTEMGKLGLKTNDIIASSSAVINLASASGQEMAYTAETLISTLKQFNLATTDSGMVADIMAKAFTETALDMTKFAEAMKYAGPVAQTTGVGITEASSALGVLADRAIYGSQAGTGLRKMMLLMDDSTSKVGKRLKAVGADTGTFTQKLQALKKMQLQSNEITSMFGLLATTQAQVLIKNAEAVDKLNESLKDSAGSAENMAKAMLANSKGSMKLFESRLEGIKLQLFSTFGDEANSMIKFFTNKLEVLGTFIANNEDAFIMWGKIIGETMKGIVNFFTSLVQAVDVSARLIVASMFGMAGLMFSPMQGTFNKIIEAYNFLAEKFDKDPIKMRFSFASDLLYNTKSLGKEAMSGLTDIAHRFKTGSERGGAGAKAVAVAPTDKQASSSAGLSAEELLARSLAGSTGTASEMKKAVDLELQMRQQLAQVNMNADEVALDRINNKYDAQLKLLQKYQQDSTASEAMRVAEIEKLNDEARKREVAKLAVMTEYENKVRLASTTMRLESEGRNEEAEMLKLQDKYAKQLAVAVEHNRGMVDVEAMKQMEIAKLEEKFANQRVAQAQQEYDAKARASQAFYSGLGSLVNALFNQNKKNAKLAKGIAIGEAMVNTYVGANKALASAAPPVNFIAMGAVITAGLANVLQIKNQKYANGGIVGGTSFQGDRVKALVNSGEMILNRKQQSNLFNLANGRTNNNNNSTAVYGGEINVHVGADADRGMVVDAMNEAMQQNNIELSRMIRENSEQGVTA